jgi:hypothetical protein
MDKGPLSTQRGGAQQLLGSRVDVLVEFVGKGLGLLLWDDDDRRRGRDHVTTWWLSL